MEHRCEKSTVMEVLWWGHYCWGAVVKTLSQECRRGSAVMVAEGQGLVMNCGLVQAAIGCCILRWWCFSCHQLAQRSHMHVQWESPATCTGGVFLHQLAHLLVCIDIQMSVFCNLRCVVVKYVVVIIYSASCKIP